MSSAQVLETKIPKDAQAVVSVKGDMFLELMSLSAINESEIGKRILKELRQSSKGADYKSLSELGLKLNSKAYYFFKGSDSISYHSILTHIADAEKVEKFFYAVRNLKIERNGETRTVTGANGTEMAIWNNDYIIITSALLHNEFFYNRKNGNNYGLERISYSDFYNEETTTTEYEDSYGYESVVPVDAVKEAADAAMVAAEAAAAKSSTKTQPYDGVTNIEMPVESPVEDYFHNNYDEVAYQQALDSHRIAERALLTNWVPKFSQQIFNANNSMESILANSKYLKAQDKNAAANLYIEEVGTLYQQMFNWLYYFGSGVKGYSANYGTMSANLFLEKDKIKLQSTMEMDPNTYGNTKAIYKHKLNKKFADYYNNKRVIGAVSYAFNTEAYLNQLPQWLSTAYSAYAPTYKQDIEIAAELLHVILDEKAIANVIKGDALLLFNDLGPKTYTYTTYEYDDEYNKTEIEKTKTESLPDFLFMMSTGDEALLKRLLNYAEQKNIAQVQNGIYTISERPNRDHWKFYVQVKNGILFVSTSARDAQDIANNNYVSNINDEQKKLLFNNNAGFYLNPKNIVGKISMEEFVDLARLQDLNNLFGTTGEIYFKTTGIKNNVVSGEMVAKVPEGNQNALTYFFGFVDKIARFAK